jgi:glycine/D-amino acid oxidase-like deaminating enzyme
MLDTCGDDDRTVSKSGDAIARLRDYADRFLNFSPRLLDTGRTRRPTLQRGLPIIASVPPTELHGSKRAPSNIWVSTGHGRSGMSLGAGSGKVMSDMISGREPELGMGSLHFPIDPQSIRLS